MVKVEVSSEWKGFYFLIFGAFCSHFAHLLTFCLAWRLLSGHMEVLIIPFCFTSLSLSSCFVFLCFASSPLWLMLCSFLCPLSYTFFWAVWRSPSQTLFSLFFPLSPSTSLFQMIALSPSVILFLHLIRFR